MRFAIDLDCTLELTESVLLKDASGGRQELAKVRHAGVRVALDDFGRGRPHLVRHGSSEAGADYGVRLRGGLVLFGFGCLSSGCRATS